MKKSWPDTLKKIRFETGEECWVKWENDELFYLIFNDLTGRLHKKANEPGYIVLQEAEKTEAATA